MTEEREQRREDQDRELVDDLAHRACDARLYFRKWIELEIKELDIDFIEIMPQCNDARIRSGLELKQRMVEQISRRELSGHLEYLDEITKNLKQGSTNDVVKDMWELEDGISYLRGLVRELRDIRAHLDEITDSLDT